MLKSIILVYLSFPLLLYLSFWLRFPYNGVFVLATGIGLCFAIYNSLKEPKRARVISSKGQFIAILILSIGIAVISGAGGFVLQRGDWTKHNVILNDLIQYTWPVYYGVSAYVSDTTLVYYLAYYLPSALVGKIFGWQATHYSLFAFTATGTILFLLFLQRHLMIRSRWLFFFFFISGLDLIGWIFIKGFPIDLLYLETYAQHLQYSSYISQIAWVPQHALSAWLLYALMYRDYLDKDLHLFPYYIGVGLLWSPFVALGLCIVFLPLYLWQTMKNITRKKYQYFLLLGILISLVIFLYFKSQIPVLQDSLHLYWTTDDLLRKLFHMAVFLTAELFVFLPIVLFEYRKETRDKMLYIMWIFLTLTVVPQFMYGAANDWTMRVTMPILVGLSLSVLVGIQRIFLSKSALRWYVLVVLVLGMFTPFTQMYLLKDVSNPATNEQSDRNMTQAHIKYGVIHQQYMGSASRLFGKFFGNYNR